MFTTQSSHKERVAKGRFGIGPEMRMTKP
jgi:hypothetical protein